MNARDLLRKEDKYDPALAHKLILQENIFSLVTHYGYKLKEFHSEQDAHSWCVEHFNMKFPVTRE